MDTESNCLLCGKDYIHCQCGVEDTLLAGGRFDPNEEGFIHSQDLLDMCYDSDDKC